MTLSDDLEGKLWYFDAEIADAWANALARLGGTQRPKLGDLNMREGFYEEAKPLLRQLYQDFGLRHLAFGQNRVGTRSRRLLLVFMSELIYWEYDNSFWDKLREVLSIDNSGSHYRWFTEQMERGFSETGIPLIRTFTQYSERREFVRTIIAESGFSRQLVEQAKRFVAWFFDQHSDLDPRSLDATTFDSILTEYGLYAWNKSEMFDLLRNMIETVNRLLREIRRHSLASGDLRDPRIISELEATLGFHPVRGIFGFRREEDIQELLERLSTRVRPDTFYAMLEQKIRFNAKGLWITLPDGQTITPTKVSDVPVIFGQYRLRDPHQSEIHVVPREALTLERLEEKLKRPRRAFHPDGENYSYIHDEQPFEVYHGTAEPEAARRYQLSNTVGYLWYGKQRIGVPIQAEREGCQLANLAPRHDVWLSPRIRLSWDKTALEVVIPSFVCYEPKFARKTIRLELNERPIEKTTYVIGRDGALQFQSTRVAPVLTTDQRLDVALVTLDGRQVVTRQTVSSNMQTPLLFDANNREMVAPGIKHYGGTRFVLFSPYGMSVKPGPGVEITKQSIFGGFGVHHLQWTPHSKDTPPFELNAGDRRWSFSQPLEINASLFCRPAQGMFRPNEVNTAFTLEDIQVKLHLAGQTEVMTVVKDTLSLIIEKDAEFVADFSLAELERLGSGWAIGVKEEFGVNITGVVSYLINHHLVDRRIGAYRLILMLRPELGRDLESVSELEFTILPCLKAEGTDIPMAEGEESLVTVLCDEPLLADEESTSLNALRVMCRPGAEYDPGLQQLSASSVNKTIRLSYPPAKVRLSFVPKLFAVRIVSGQQIRLAENLTYSQMGDSVLVVLAHPDSPIAIKCGTKEVNLRTDHRGQARLALRDLVPVVDAEHTEVEVNHSGFSKQMHIVWHPSVRFVPDKCSFVRSSANQGRLTLTLVAEGPSEAKLTVKLMDNLFHSHGQTTHSVATLRQGSLNLPVDLPGLNGAKVIFCTVQIKGETQDTVRIPCEGTINDDFTEQLTTQLEQMKGDLVYANPLEQLHALELFESLGQPTLANTTLSLMYSIRNLDQIFLTRKSIQRKQLRAYFARFNEMPPNHLSIAPVAKLKNWCEIPILSVQAACAEALIARCDGAGVETIIDLMAQQKLTWDGGLAKLKRNVDCTSGMIRDMVEWDDLELEDDSYIELMEKLSREFHPAMARRARAAQDWRRAIALQKSGDIVCCEGVSHDQRGLIVPFGLIVGIVPVEELDPRRQCPLEDRRYVQICLQKLLHQKLYLTMLDVNRKTATLIMSERRASAKAAASIMAELRIGDTREGVITRVYDLGALVDLGGLEGSLHKSELSWDPVDNAHRVISIGDRVKVYILSVHADEKRVELSLKRLLPDPWLEIANAYEIGQWVDARVTGITRSGVQVRIQDEIDGFVPLSELSQELVSRTEIKLRAGDSLRLRVIRVDKQEHQLITSQTQLQQTDVYWGSFRVRT